MTRQAGTEQEQQPGLLGGRGSEALASLHCAYGRCLRASLKRQRVSGAQTVPVATEAGGSTTTLLGACPADSAHRAGKRGNGFLFLRFLVAGLLLWAAAMKGYELATGPVAGSGPLASRWLMTAVVEVELMLGLLLISGIWQRAVWLAAVACFAVFTCVTGYETAIGLDSCGCFGRVRVDPRITLVADVSVLMCLLIWRPAREKHSRTACRAGAVLVIGLGGVIGGAGAWAMLRYRPASLSDSGTLPGNGTLVVLEPHRWPGRPLPLLKYIDIGGQLESGLWAVVLYSHSCPHCREALQRLKELSAGWPEEADGPRLALIEMPPYGAQSMTVGGLHPRWVMGRLSDAREWFVETPTFLAVRDGLVECAASGWPYRDGLPCLGSLLQERGRIRAEQEQ